MGWRNDRLIGRPPWEFVAGYSENDTWNYFWSRRDPAKRPAPPGTTVRSSAA